MITFADVNDVASTAATLGQLRGLKASSDAEAAAQATAAAAADPSSLWTPGDVHEAMDALVAAAQARADAATAAAAAAGTATPGTSTTPGTSPPPGSLASKPLVAEPAYKQWWFWAAIGGGVAFLGVGGYFLLRSKNTPSVVSHLPY